MPENDVHLTIEYTKIEVQTPVTNLVYNGKTAVVVTITSALANFETLSVANTDLTKDMEYSVTGTNTTVITLHKEYLDTLNNPTQFVATFHEGGEIAFAIRLYGLAPVANVNYSEMKLTGLVANAQYKINNEEKTADAQGNINIEKTWSSQTIEIIKAKTESETESKPQSLDIRALYTIHVDGKELRFTAAGTQVNITAKRKDGYRFKGWTASGVTLAHANAEDVTFEMPAKDVEFVTKYTPIITTKVEEMVYNGTKAVTIRFDMPMVEFQDIEYNGRKLVKEVEYTIASGSTIITFTKAFLDTIQDDMKMTAVFVNNEVAFTIKHEVLAPPLVEPTSPSKLPETAPILPVAAKNEGGNTTPQRFVNNPNTGDRTNAFIVFTTMVVSASVVLLLKKRKKQC